MSNQSVATMYDDTRPLQDMFKIKLNPNSKAPTSDSINFYKDKSKQYKGIEPNKKYSVGILGGKVNDMMVVDLDTNKWDMDNHPWTLAFGKDPRAFNTYTARSCRGGFHLYFKYDKDLSRSKISAISIDIISSEKYIVAPHSHIYDLKRNIIHKDYTVYHDTSIKEMPEAIKHFLFEHIYTSTSKRNEKNRKL